jgi:hypothetical protein
MFVDPTDQPSYVPKRAIAAYRSPNTLTHNMITKTAYFSWITNVMHENSWVVECDVLWMAATVAHDFDVGIAVPQC